MPILYILAGPNGAGKTTWYTTAIEQEFIHSSLPFINVDLITLHDLGGYSEENFAKADAIARERIGNYIHKGESFMIESNLSKASEYEWIQLMIKKGYETVLYFLGTDDLEININRVKKRVKEGGHDIPESIIEHRYKNGFILFEIENINFQRSIRH
ncbi:MAG: hypothetical protein JWQ09_573 [Segetibacter sp.]|nr:hypothetical protein [Segetibacter sp.]